VRKIGINENVFNEEKLWFIKFVSAESSCGLPAAPRVFDSLESWTGKERLCEDRKPYFAESPALAGTLQTKIIQHPFVVNHIISNVLT